MVHLIKDKVVPRFRTLEAITFRNPKSGFQLNYIHNSFLIRKCESGGSRA